MRRHTTAIAAIAATALGLFLATARAAEAKPAIAILGLEVVEGSAGMDEQTAQFAKALSDALRQRAQGTGGVFKLAPDSNKDLLEMKLLSDCADEGKSCMAAIGTELGAQRVLYGKVEKRADGYQVTLKLLNVETKALEKNTSALVPFNETKSVDVVRWGRTLYERMTGASDQGTLVIKANVDRGTVYVDGQAKGNLVGGTARISGLQSGTHELAIEAEGHLRYEARAEVTGGGEDKVEAELEANALPGGGDDDDDGAGPGGQAAGGKRPGRTSRILFWSSLVATGASATALTVTGLQVRGSLNDAKLDAIRDLRENEGIELQRDDACADAGKNLPEAQGVVDACDKGKSRAMLANIFIGTTVVSALATTYFYYRGYVKAKRSNAEGGSAMTRRKKRSMPMVIVAPSISPTQVGAGVRIEF